MASKPDRSIVPMLSRERRAVGVVATIATLRLFGLFALLPVLSLYAAGLDGATPILIGFAVGAYGLTQAGLQIPLGALSDRVGRLPVIVGGLLVFAAGSVVAALGDSIWDVILGRLLQGAGAISAALTALVADATRDEVRTRSMAFLGIGIGASFMVAIVVGPVIAAHIGVQGLFWLVAGLALVAALILVALPRGISRPEQPSRWNILPAFRPRLLQIDFYIFLLHAILTATFVGMPFLLTNRLEMPLTSHWKLYIASLLVSLAGTIPLIIRDERQRRATTIAIAVVLLFAAEMMLTFLGFGTVPVFIALVLFFAGVNFLEAGLPARLSLLADEEVRGASLGVYSSSQFLGAFAGGLIGGRFLHEGQPGDVFFVCALLAAIWLAGSGLFRERSPRNRGGN
jgi:MFS family permease